VTNRNFTSGIVIYRTYILEIISDVVFHCMTNADYIYSEIIGSAESSTFWVESEYFGRWRSQMLFFNSNTKTQFF